MRSNAVPELVQAPYPGNVYREAPRNVYWETTIACDLACKHCRADAISTRDPLELVEDEARSMLRDIHSMGSMLILTGGDPLKRPDLFDLVAYGRSIDLPISITPSATPRLTRDAVRRCKDWAWPPSGSAWTGPRPRCTMRSGVSQARLPSQWPRWHGRGSFGFRCS